MTDVTREAWIGTIRLKIRDIKIIADWASIVGYGSVHDDLQYAISRLNQYVERYTHEDLEAKSDG